MSGTVRMLLLTCVVASHEIAPRASHSRHWRQRATRLRGRRWRAVRVRCLHRRAAPLRRRRRRAAADVGPQQRCLQQALVQPVRVVHQAAAVADMKGDRAHHHRAGCHVKEGGRLVGVAARFEPHDPGDSVGVNPGCGLADDDDGHELWVDGAKKHRARAQQHRRATAQGRTDAEHHGAYARVRRRLNAAQQGEHARHRGARHHDPKADDVSKVANPEFGVVVRVEEQLRQGHQHRRDVEQRALADEEALVAEAAAEVAARGDVKA
mmetsp:Transcript_99540/g.304322  ORF Transcript_99540/g.304322 Transcript_99540/m.304322 type:complete len:266 (+) Transcript_99540:656-1453(+)